ncbi:MAG: BLUF domain-containing protein [Verrucomicrobiae bacterium]|nr:BLUF domain-containing protein [Verrucomicrobiae bacterium]
MSEKVFFYIYTSTACKPFSQAELCDLLAVSREKNARSGLSGMLLYKFGDFMQMLEGSEPAVRSLVKTIQADPRHDNMVKLLEGYTNERQFPGWYMGFYNLDTEAVRRLPGYTDFINTPLSTGLSADPTACQRLLEIFKEQRAELGSPLKAGSHFSVSIA